MKKIVFAALLLMLSCILYAEADYRNGNGTVLRRETLDNKEIEIRKFEISNFMAGLYCINDNQPIYDDYSKKNRIGTLKKDKIDNEMGSYVVLDFYEICTIKYTGLVDPWGDQRGEMWIKLSDGNVTGWLCINDSYYINYYENDEYSYLGDINGYSVRKLSQYVSGDDKIIVVRDQPGYGTNKIAEIEYNLVDEDGWVQSFEVVAITEGNEFVKIEYEKGKFGWVRGNCLSVERGGPVFLLPEEEILSLFDFCWL